MRIISASFLGLALCAGIAPVLAAATDATPIKTFPVTVKIAQQAIKVDVQAGKVVAHLPNGKQQVLTEAPDKDTMAFSDHVALQGDFNFDGLTDLAVYESSGYGGVNQFYQLFLSGKTGRFTPFTTSISNPTLLAEQHTLHSAQRSGPRWYVSEFQFSKGALAQRVERVMIDGSLWHNQFFNASGKLQKSLVTEETEEATSKTSPASRAIRIAKADLYDKPLESRKTRMYVIKGDKVTLLDYMQSEEDGSNWLLIRFKGQKLVEKWLKGEAVLAE